MKDVSQKKPDLLFYIYPRPFLELYQIHAQNEKLPLSLLLGISRQESTFAPAIVSPAKAVGLMQLIVPTAERMAKAKGLTLGDTFEDLQNPAVNISLGSAYLGLLLKHYQQNEVQAVAAYNAGEGMIDLWLKNRILPDQMAWIEAIPFGETRNYVKTVLRNRAVYDLLSVYHGASSHKYPREKVGGNDLHLKKRKKL
jgi:soluble lytic murein transglycosylase